MRLLIKERLKDYNLRKGTKLNMRDLAHLLYSHSNTIDQSKYNKLSTINTGARVASVAELVDLARLLDCEIDDLIESHLITQHEQ